VRPPFGLTRATPRPDTTSGSPAPAFENHLTDSHTAATAGSAGRVVKGCDAIGRRTVAGNIRISTVRSGRSGRLARSLEALEGRNLFSAFAFDAAPALIMGTGQNLTSVVSEDFNGDGLADLAVSNPAMNNFAVVLSRGDGGFTDPVYYSTGSYSWWIAAGDFNGDGFFDLATANTNDNSVTVRLGAGDGSFAAATEYAVGSQPRFLTAADFNGDGRDDLAVINDGAGTVSVLLAQANGSFVGAATLTAAGAKAAVGADLNGDGRADLALAVESANAVDVLYGAGDGTFGAPTRYATGGAPRAIAAADITGDGRPDLITTPTARTSASCRTPATGSPSHAVTPPAPSPAV
jgi:hypothetical protein